MDILIVGPGAMGCLFAARLKRAGQNVTLLDYVQERAVKIAQQGIIVEDLAGQEYRVDVPSVIDADSLKPEFVLICVKSNETSKAALAIRPWLLSETNIVTLQNGVGNVEILEEIFGKDRVLGGVTAEGATLLGWGKIRHAGDGETILGPIKGPGSPGEKIIAAFNKAGF